MKQLRPVSIYAATMLWWIAIWVVSSSPSNKLPSIRIIGWDKLIHCLIYLMLALLVNRSMVLLKIKGRWVLLVYLLLLVSAAMDEYHQKFIPGRSVSIWDFLANSSGLLVGFGILWHKNDCNR